MESTVEREYVCRVETVGPGDLAGFRDAVLLYSEALRVKKPFYCQAGPEASELLVWLGLDFLPPAETSAGLAVDLGYPSAEALAQESLADFRERGYLGRTLFSALVRSSYGPDEPGYFPTASELGFYFDRALLRRSVRWDQEYLDECQGFFFEELTPTELLNATLELLPAGARECAEPFTEELQGVVFLVGEQETTLAPLRELLSSLLVKSEGKDSLKRFLERVQKWNSEGAGQAWEGLSDTDRRTIVESVLSGRAENAAEILAASGRALLKWRAED